MKKALVAAAMLLTTVGAQASNFRAADQVYIPVAGHAAGASGVFISDVYLSNLTADTVTVSAIVQPLGVPTNPSVPSTIGTDYNNVIELAPFERKEFKDFFRSGLNIAGNMFGFVILNACEKGADCGPATQDADGYSEHFRSISVETRIYQIASETAVNPPTTGQLFSGLPWYSYVSELDAGVGLDRVFITGIVNTGGVGQAGTFRTNIGLINASQYSSTTLVVRAYQGALNNTGFKLEAVVNLTPLENVQRSFSQLFPTLPTGSNYFVTVEQRQSIPTPDAPTSCTSGCPAFLAYGSVLDNVSGDATTLESQYLVELSSAALEAIYGSGSGKGTSRRAVRSQD